MSEKKTSLKQIPGSRLMSKPVKTIQCSKSLDDSMKMMWENDIGCIIVTDGNSPVGIITERDVLRRMAKDASTLNLTMTEVMSKPLKSVPPTMTIWDAMETIENNKIRQLAVVDAGKLVGVLTQRDIVHQFFSHRDLLSAALELEETGRFMLGQ